jgi:hypothetical protein
VVLAVRRFQGVDDFAWKPATKLYNAWHAGVPAVLGRESAYRAEWKSELDYWEVDTVEEALDALKKLRDDVALRRAMVENGKQRSQETEPQVLAQQWMQFLTEVAVPAYHTWCSHRGLHQKKFFLKRQTALLEHRLTRFFWFKVEGIQKRWHARKQHID